MSDILVILGIGLAVSLVVLWIIGKDEASKARAAAKSDQALEGRLTLSLTDRRGNRTILFTRTYPIIDNGEDDFAAPSNPPTDFYYPDGKTPEEPE